MLEGALVERYSRQILLPEVGGLGQERLLASQVTIVGHDAAARFAAMLLARAGVNVHATSGPSRELRVAAGAATVVARWHESAGAVATLVGRPCTACVDDSVLALPSPIGAAPGAGAHEQAVGALVAAEALRVLLGLATSGRVQTLDLARGAFAGRGLSGDGCAACGPYA